ncbi:phosphorothioated DNA-binding restriction endonuclease [Paenibacillus sp. DMB20]|uniref:phosphorothioated DNA-binding restriction endonuclease n=1 Tax=Paenibacillus sp. DMB20 TaxID=1642570 RepID=UPI0006277305|nr:HNH endonuclease [Paenibacillus sp. DMB20]KKO54314.1 restriction endonuclease [Paenibacillus sp. DMB20]
MEAAELKGKISNLSIWKKNGQRAPHKPLLILLGLAQIQQNNIILPYELVREKLKRLLIEFGPARKSYHPEEPFVRLTTDGIWRLTGHVDKRNFSDKQLLNERLAGGFNEEVLALLQNNELLIQELAELLLNEHFPGTMHQDILDEIGLDLFVRKKRKRDPHFRDRILKAYEYSCAVCGFNVRLGHHLVAIDAAHIQWHQAGGPDREENGIALYSLHHKLFDRGVFTITGERELLVAEQAHGTHGFEEWLMRFHGKKVRSPIHPEYTPRERFIGWHIREVFRGPARYRVK